MGYKCYLHEKPYIMDGTSMCDGCNRGYDRDKLTRIFTKHQVKSLILCDKCVKHMFDILSHKTDFGNILQEHAEMQEQLLEKWIIYG